LTRYAVTSSAPGNMCRGKTFGILVIYSHSLDPVSIHEDTKRKQDQF